MNSFERAVEKINSSRYRTSLELIFEAVKKIWSPTDSIRIIKDFTDHGIEHSLRLLEITEKIIINNRSNHFTDEELYLLYCGILLHDIGMQCDVVKYPDILIKAEKLGANFECAFESTLSNNFSVDEQKAIRNNHGFLTGAWIDYSYRTENTILGKSIKSVPDILVADLIDVCIYHTKCSIYDCDDYFKHFMGHRKRLIATILRLADELDIDANRVTLETVKQFNLDPSNSIYWWLHNRTRISYNKDNSILLKVILCPEDFEEYQALITNHYILQFQVKNQHLLNILAQHAIPIVISPNSGLVSDEYIESLPEDIKEILSNWSKQSNVRQDDRNVEYLTSVINESITESIKLVKPQKDSIWANVSEGLEIIRKKFNFDYGVLFIGEREMDTILFPRAVVGYLLIENLHFNWKKSNLDTEDYNLYKYLEQSNDNLSQKLLSGFRGKSNPFSKNSLIVPVHIGGGPYGIIVFGNHVSQKEHNRNLKLIYMICREFGNYILTTYLVILLNKEKKFQEEQLMLSFHQLRSDLQNIQSNLAILGISDTRKMDFTKARIEEAKKLVLNSINSIVETTSVGKVSPILVSIANREYIPFIEFIQTILAERIKIIEERNIIVELDDSIFKLEHIYGNLKYLFEAFSILFDLVINNSKEMKLYSRTQEKNNLLYISFLTNEETTLAIKNRIYMKDDDGNIVDRDFYITTIILEGYGGKLSFEHIGIDNGTYVVRFLVTLPNQILINYQGE